MMLQIGDDGVVSSVDEENLIYVDKNELEQFIESYQKLEEENEQLKKSMIEVVDRYIKNVECNPPSSTQTYMKIKRTLNNIREDLRSLIEDFE